MTMVWSPDYLGSPGKMVLAKDYIHGPADPDVAAYIAAVETADGQGLEEEVKVAYSNFITGCKADGIWNAIKASCILAGARTLSGALVPLVGTAPTNNGPFVAADYDRKTGLKGNLGSKNLDSGFSNTDLDQDNQHLSCWVSTANTNFASNTSSYYIGFSGAISTNLNTRFSDLQVRSSSGTLNSGTGDGNATNFIGVSRSSSSQATARVLSSNTNYSSTSAPYSITPINVFVFDRDDNSLPGDGRIAFYSIGEALPDLSPTQTGLALLDTRVSTLISDLGAAIP